MTYHTVSVRIRQTQALGAGDVLASPSRFRIGVDAVEEQFEGSVWLGSKVDFRAEQ